MFNYTYLSQLPNQEINKEEIYQALLENPTLDAWWSITKELIKIRKADFLWFNVNDKLKDKTHENISIFGKLLKNDNMNEMIKDFFFNEYSVRSSPNRQFFAQNVLSHDEKNFLNTLLQKNGLSQKIKENETILEYVFNFLGQDINDNIFNFEQLDLYSAFAKTYNDLNAKTDKLEMYAKYEEKYLNNLMNNQNYTSIEQANLIQEMCQKIESASIEKRVELITNYLNDNTNPLLNNLKSGTSRSYLVYLMPLFKCFQDLINTEDKKKIVLAICLTKDFTADTRNLCIDYASSRRIRENKKTSSLNEVQKGLSESISILVSLTELTYFKEEYQKNYVLNEKNRLEAMMNIIEKNNDSVNEQVVKPNKKVKI